MTFDAIKSQASEIVSSLGILEWPLLWILGLAAAFWGCWGIVKVYRKPLHKTTLYTAGVNAKGVTVIRMLFIAAGLEAILGVVSTVAGWPIIVDLSLLATLIALTWGVWWFLRSNPKFKPAKIAAIVFSPLGLGVTGALPATAKFADQSPTIVKAVAASPAGEVVASASSRVGRIIENAIGITKPTVIGKAWFRNTHVMGGLGDQIAARIYTARGYTKLPSKFSTIHGIDGVYAKYSNGGRISELVIVENKVNGSRLSADQMTDAWLLKACDRMIASGKTDVGATGLAVKEALALGSNVTVHRHLVNINLETGTCVAKNLDNNAKGIGDAWIGDYTSTVSKVLEDAVKAGKIRLME